MGVNRISTGLSTSHGPSCVAQSAPRRMVEGMDAQCWALCPGCGPSCSSPLDLLHDGQSATWCLDQYARLQRDDPTVDLSISLTPRQLAAARVLWSDRLRGLVAGGPA